MSSFESGDFNINLPEVYLRGFVRLYSRFLGLDQDAIVADLEVELGVSSQSQRKSLGSITTSELSENKENIPTNKKSVSRVSKGSGLAKILVVLVIIGVGLSLVVTLAYQLFNSAEDPVEIDPSELLISEKKDVPDQVPANPVVKIENNQLKLAAIGPIDRLIVCDEGVTPKSIMNLAICHPVGKKQSNLMNHLDAIVHHLKTCGLPWMMVQKKRLMAWVLKLQLE